MQFFVVLQKNAIADIKPARDPWPCQIWNLFFQNRDMLLPHNIIYKVKRMGEVESFA